ncbi:MAG: DUF507 family protein [Deltaproteobacteria bacterium]|nr:DUF507 family protein [Deltaproteobacteria bacterium]
MTNTTPSTNHTSLKTLAKSILNKLENNKYIVFNPKERNDLQEDLVRRLQRSILTEEDITKQVRSQVTAAGDALTEQNITETDAFQSQKRALKSRMGDNMLHGFYFQDTLRGICISVCKFLFESPYVEDVFESDDAIQKLVMDTIQSFDETKAN